MEERKAGRSATATRARYSTRAAQHTAASTNGATRAAHRAAAGLTSICHASGACTAPSILQTGTATRQADQASHEQGRNACRHLEHGVLHLIYSSNRRAEF